MKEELLWELLVKSISLSLSQIANTLISPFLSNFSYIFPQTLHFLPYLHFISKKRKILMLL